MSRCATMLVATCMCACTGAPIADATVRRDSAGIHIVESRAPRAVDSVWRVGAPELAFAPDELEGIVGAVLLDDGTVVVADHGSASLKWFAPNGSLLRSTGGRGDGPGEFRLIQSIGRTSTNGVWVYDFSLARITRFDSTGRLLAVTTLVPPVVAGVAVGMVADSQFVVAGQWRSGGPRDRPGLVRDSVAIVRYAGAASIDTLMFAPGREFVLTAEPGGRTVMQLAVFGHRLSATTWNAGVVVGPGVTHEIEHRVGNTRTLIRWDGPPLHIGATDIGAWIDAHVATQPTAGRDALRAMLEASPAATAKPAYGRLVPDETGNLWVAEYALPGAEPARWDVFAPDGEWVAVVAVPQAFRPSVVDRDRMIGVAVDTNGIERLQARRLERQPGRAAKSGQ